MQTKCKRTLSLLLAFLMLFGGTTAGLAAEADYAADGFVSAAGDSNGYSISALGTDGLTVTATVTNSGPCTLVAAAYAEQSKLLLGSGSVRIAANCATADVTLDADAVPEHYTLRAFLLDEENNALCNSYEMRAYNPDAPIDLTRYRVGDIVTFGSYPQSLVSDSATLAALNALPKTWHSYRYYSGSGYPGDGKMTASDFMQYADVRMGDRYRAVLFTQYRPSDTGSRASINSTSQTENGYYINTVYWFKYEPLQWRVLSPSTGLVMCNSIIDSQPFNNYYWETGKDAYGNTAGWGNAGKTYYANNYAESSVRQWLNADFYDTAFSALQKTNIAETTLDNSAYDTAHSAYSSASTTDKVFLLSLKDVTNSAYGFNSSGSKDDSARSAAGSEYAKCQGLFINSNYSSKNSEWMLRTAGWRSYCVCSADRTGWLWDTCKTYYSIRGIRPALRMKPASNILKSNEADAVQSAVGTVETRTVQKGTAYTVTRNAANAGEKYVLLVRRAGANGLAASDLFYIDQQTAAGGTASFTYVPRFSGACTVEIIGKFRPTYTVTWNIEGKLTTNTIPVDDAIPKPADPSKTGYTFTGWSPEVPKTMPAQNMTFTAVFKVNTYTVNWVVDNRKTTDKADYGAPIVKPADPVKDDYIFTGWLPAVPETMPAKDMTFTAQFKPVSRVIGISAQDMTIYYKAEGKLPLTVQTQSDPAYTVAYKTEKSGVISIDDSGTVKTLHWGKTRVDITVTDSSSGKTFTDTSTVQVKCRPMQWLIIYLFFGWLWY